MSESILRNINNNFSRDSFQEFINELGSPFTALSSAKSKRSRILSFEPKCSSTPAACKGLDFGNKRRLNSRRAIIDDLNDHDECSTPKRTNKVSFVFFLSNMRQRYIYHSIFGYKIAFKPQDFFFKGVVVLGWDGL
jgi:hypothetical protein